MAWEAAGTSSDGLGGETSSATFEGSGTDSFIIGASKRRFTGHVLLLLLLNERFSLIFTRWWRSKVLCHRSFPLLLLLLSSIINMALHQFSVFSGLGLMIIANISNHMIEVRVETHAPGAKHGNSLVQLLIRRLKFVDDKLGGG